MYQYLKLVLFILLYKRGDAIRILNIEQDDFTAVVQSKMRRKVTSSNFFLE